METVTSFVDELAGRLVPGCDGSVVRAVLARASAGHAGPQGRDGRRVSAITPSGVPFEASVTAGPGRSARSLRYVTETATHLPFFGPRLAAQRAALDDLIGWLPAPARDTAGDHLPAVVDVLFPDVAAVRARTRFATTFGIVHRAETPDALAGLKLYGNVRADPDALARLRATSPAFAALLARVDGLRFVVPHFVSVEVDAAGRLGHKLYLRTHRADVAALALLARRFDAEATGLPGLLGSLGVGREVWQRPVFVCCEAGDPDGADGAGPALSFHLPARALGLDRPTMAALARALVERHGDDTDGSGLDALDALDAAAERAGGRWDTTVIGVGVPGAATACAGGKVNTYVAPAAGAQPEPFGSEVTR